MVADSYDLDALRRSVLDPLSPGSDRRHRAALHDLATDRGIRCVTLDYLVLSGKDDPDARLF